MGIDDNIWASSIVIYMAYKDMHSKTVREENYVYYMKLYCIILITMNETENAQRVLSQQM